MIVVIVVVVVVVVVTEIEVIVVIFGVLVPSFLKDLQFRTIIDQLQPKCCHHLHK